jgi:hypothetical protein
MPELTSSGDLQTARSRRRSGHSPSRWSLGMLGTSCSPKRDTNDCRAALSLLSSKEGPIRSPRLEAVAEGPRRSPPPEGSAVANVARNGSEVSPGKSGGEDVVRNVYRRHATAFFDELRTWFTKEARMLRSTAEKQLEVDQIKSLRERVEQLEASTMVPVPTSAGDAAAGAGTSPRSISPRGRLATEALVGLDGASLRGICREEARRALEELRGELLGGDLLCDELLSGGAGLRPVLERLIAESSMAEREMALREQVAELRASVESAVAAATSAATAEIGRLDGAFRSSLAAEVRDLGCLCEGVRARIEALDQSAADHIGHLSTRVAELEEVRCGPSSVCSRQTSGSCGATSLSSSLAFKKTLVATSAASQVRAGSSSADDTFAVPGGVATVDAGLAEQELNGLSCHMPPGGEVLWAPPALSSAQGLVHPADASAPVPPFCAGLAPISVGTGPAKNEMWCAPSTPPKRHIPPGSAAAAALAVRASVSPSGSGGYAPGGGRSSIGGQKAKMWSSPPRVEARGGC